MQQPQAKMRGLVLLACAALTANVQALGTASPADIPGLLIVDASVPAEYVNTITSGAAGNQPFEAGTTVYKVHTTEAFVAIRSYYTPAEPGKAGQAGSWVAPLAETRGLSRAELMDRLALPVNADGTRNNTFALVLVPAGVTFWSGKAGPITSSRVDPVGAYWGEGGGIQYYVGRNAGDVAGFQVPLRNYVLAAPMGEVNLLAYSPRLSGNALKVGRYMDGLTVQAYSDLDKVFTALDILNLSTERADPRLQQVIAQLGAERHGALGLAGLHQSRLFMDQLTSASSPFAPAGQRVPEVDDKGRRSWIKLQGVRSRQSSDAERTGFTQNTTTLVAGMAMRHDENWTFGAALGYLSSDLDWADSAPGQARLQSGHVGAYATYRAAAVMATAQLFQGYSSIDTHRSISIPDAGLWAGYSSALNRTASGNSHAFATGARLDVARLMAVPRVRLAPFLGLEYQRFDRQQFTEKGADSINLAVHGKTLEDLRARFGVALESPLGTAGSLDWSVDGRLLTAPRLGGGRGAIQAGFAGQGGTFSSNGWAAPAVLNQMGIGLSGRSKHSDLALAYHYERGAGFASSALLAKADWRF